MCVALPRGNQQESPTGKLKRVYQWIGLGVLVIRIVTAGLAGWVRQRWNSDTV